MNKTTCSTNVALVRKEPNGTLFFSVFEDSFWKDYKISDSSFAAMIESAQIDDRTFKHLEAIWENPKYATKSKKKTRNVRSRSKKTRRASGRRAA